MEKVCSWCNSEDIDTGKDRVFWELPDGTRAIEIYETPTIFCGDCSMIYQTESLIKQIEDQLFLVKIADIGKSIAYKELMEMPRLLKRNYFDFTS